MVDLVIIILLIFIVVLIYGMTLLIRKIQTYENYIIELKERVNLTYDAMKEADIRGSFEADDEVGDTFKILKQLVDELNGYVV